MISTDPLRQDELRCLLEEATTPLRHDVRNRIASIRSLAFFVRRKLASEQSADRDPRILEFLTKIEAEVQRTDEVIEHWSKRNHPLVVQPMRTVRLAECIRLAMETARIAPSVRVEVEPLLEASEVEANLELLGVALRCLIENAAEAVGTGNVQIRIECSNDQCRVIVTDDGPGIADPARSVERFESTKPGRLGLGLAMARRIVSRFGGDLSIGSPDHGAEVSLVLPVAGAVRPFVAAP